MTKVEAREWMSRWEAVAARQREELRAQTPEEKFRALAFLMASADLFDLSSLEGEDQMARARWVRLRTIAHEQS
jgi:hypothetical protein